MYIYRTYVSLENSVAVGGDPFRCEIASNTLGGETNFSNAPYIPGY